MTDIPISKAAQRAAMYPKSTEIMTVEEFTNFLNLHGFSDVKFAEFFGVTLQAVRLWKRGQRDISLTNTRLINLFIRFPYLMKEF